MTTDSELRTTLIERFDAIPSMDAFDIDVHVEDGMVTLNGRVDTQQTRFQVERAARKVPGIRGLKIHIKPDADKSGRIQSADQVRHLMDKNPGRWRC